MPKPSIKRQLDSLKQSLLEAVDELWEREQQYGEYDVKQSLAGISAARTTVEQTPTNGTEKEFAVELMRRLEMLRERIADKSLLRLIGKCLHVGILEGAEYSVPEEGTVQGSSLSPLLGNVYLHYVLDLWFERVVQPRLRGEAILIRCADDFVIGFETEDDARRVMKVITRRFERYSLTLHPDKTRLLDFERPPRGQLKGKGPATFGFLGFTVFWRRSRKGHWVPGFKTRKARLRRAVMSIADWCRSHRHLPVKQQQAALARRIRGHDNYFGVNGNIRSLQLLRHYVEQACLAEVAQSQGCAETDELETFLGSVAGSPAAGCTDPCPPLVCMSRTRRRSRMVEIS